MNRFGEPSCVSNRVSQRSSPNPMDELSGREVCEMLHNELNRLPGVHQCTSAEGPACVALKVALKEEAATSDARIEMRSVRRPISTGGCRNRRTRAGASWAFI